MRGHDDCPASGGPPQRVDDLCLGVRIEVGGRLVEKPEPGIAEERTGDGDTTASPVDIPGRPRPAVCPVLRQPRDDIGQPGRGDSLLDLGGWQSGRPMRMLSLMEPGRSTVC